MYVCMYKCMYVCSRLGISIKVCLRTFSLKRMTEKDGEVTIYTVPAKIFKISKFKIECKIR